MSFGGYTSGFATAAPSTSDAYLDVYSDSYTDEVVAPVGVSAGVSTSWRQRAGVTTVRPTWWSIGRSVQSLGTTVARSASWGVRAGVSKSVEARWSTFASPTSATVVPALRLRCYTPNGADLGVLPTPEGVTASYVMNDVGGLQFTYAPTAPKASLLGQPVEVAVEVSPDSGRNWREPPNSRFLYVSDGRDRLSRTDRYSVDAKSWVWRFTKARVLPNGLTNAEGKRAFNAVTPGTLLKTLFNEAQARGALAGVTHNSFTTTTDSSGARWAKVLTITYEPGLDYLTVLQNLAAQGFIDFRTQGRTLQVYNADAAMAVDRTVGSSQVAFRAGRDLTDAPFRRTWEGLANYAYFAGDGTSYEYTNSEAAAPWGRWETFISNGSVKDQGTMASLTQTELSQTNDARTEYTRGLDFSRSASMPHWDYGVGDYVWSAVDGTTPQRLRVRQLTLVNSDKNILSGNVVLNDRFLEADIRAKRRIEGIVNGASSGTGTGTPETPNNPDDKILPNPPTGLSGSSSAYLGPGGFAQSQVSLTWAAPTTNRDGTTIDDIDRYEVFQRVLESTPGSQRQVTSTTDLGVDRSPYQPGSTWLFTVKTVDTSGNRSAFSNELMVAMAQDITPPVAPTAPTITARLGILSVAWDGKPSTGTWAADFSHIEVHVSTINNFTPIDTTLADTLFAEGVSALTGYTYGTPVYVKFIAVDKAGLKSVPSTQATGTPTRLVGSDVDPNAISYEQIAFKDPGNVLADGSFETPVARSDIGGRSSSAWSFTTGDKFHGDWSATINAATAPSTFRVLQLMGGDARQQITGGDILFMRFAYKASAGSNGNLDLVAEWTSQTNTTSYSRVTAATRDNLWRTAAGKVTAPTGTKSFRIYLELGNTGSLGTYFVDALEVRRTIGTEIIEDLAVGNAQIANLAVNSAKVSELEVGKLTAGVMTADVLIAGRFRTSTTGARVEMDSTGIRLINRDNLVTVSISPSVEYLRLNSTGDVGATTSTHPFQIGPSNGNNMAFDNNEIMGRVNGQPKDLALNLAGADVHLSGMLRTQKLADDRAAFASNQADTSILFVGPAGGRPTSELWVMNGGASAFRLVRAADHVLGSAAEVKQDRTDFNPRTIVRKAKSQRWRYKEGFADDNRWHFGPMANDLPELAIGSGANAGLGLGSLVGVLWEMARLTDERLDALEEAAAGPAPNYPSSKPDTDEAPQQPEQEDEPISE